MAKARNPAEEIRLQYLSHEDRVRGRASFTIWWGVLIVAIGLRIIPTGAEYIKPIDIGLILHGLVDILTGMMLYRLNPYVRIWFAFDALRYLGWYPIGTMDGLICLWLLYSPTGNFVFSREYRKIILVTPHLRPAVPSAVRSAIIGLVLVYIYWFFLRGQT